MTKTPSPPENRPELEDSPPVLGSWRRIYGLVLGVLVFQIALYAWLSWQFSP